MLFREYESVSKELFSRYISSACSTRADEVRMQRREKRQDCHEFIACVNSKMESFSADSLSNIDFQSVTSSSLPGGTGELKADEGASEEVVPSSSAQVATHLDVEIDSEASDATKLSIQNNQSLSSFNVHSQMSQGHVSEYYLFLH